MTHQIQVTLAPAGVNTFPQRPHPPPPAPSAPPEAPFPPAALGMGSSVPLCTISVLGVTAGHRCAP